MPAIIFAIAALFSAIKGASAGGADGEEIAIALMPLGADPAARATPEEVMPVATTEASSSGCKRIDRWKMPSHDCVLLCVHTSSSGLAPEPATTGRNSRLFVHVGGFFSIVEAVPAGFHKQQSF
jgi:hypothetical protein